MCAKFKFSAIIYAEVIVNNSFSTGKPLSPRPLPSYMPFLTEKVHLGTTAIRLRFNDPFIYVNDK